MGRRKRKKIIKKKIRKLPKIFTCPSCGHQSIFVKIKKAESVASVYCSNCNISANVPLKLSDEPIDAFNEFIDKYYRGEITLE